MSNKWKYPKGIDEIKFSKDRQKEVLHQLDHARFLSKKRNDKRPLLVVAISLLLLASLVMASDMQHVLANIPYISQFIEQQEERSERMEVLFDGINRTVQEEGYQIGNSQVNHNEKEIIIEIKNWSGNDDEMTRSLLENVREVGLKNFDLKVIPYEEKQVKTDVTEEEMERYYKDSEELKASLKQRLKAEEFEPLFPVNVQINPTQGVYINVIVAETETRLTLLKQIMSEEGKKYGEKPKIDVRQVQRKAREQELRWEKTGAVNHIAQAMMESDEFPVTGFSYSFHPYPLQIKVKTSLKTSDKKAEKVAEEIKNEINLFIQTGDGTESIRKDEYDVNVLGKDKEVIE